MTKRILCLLLTLLLLPLSGCALFQTTVEDMDEADATPYYTMGEGFLTALFAEDYAGCFALFSEDLQNQLSQTELQDAWENVRLTYGDPASVASRKPYWINGEGTVVYQVACAHGGCSVQLTYDADNNVAGLWFGLAEEDFPYEVAVPEGVVEYEITLGEGTDTPLKALVTLPADAEGPVPGVVLIHGSGASDRNEAIGACYPFADIAHGLAQRGIASIRYDKRTFTYGNTYTEEEVNQMTVREEVLDDAQLAIDALAAQDGVDPARLVVVGHSLGGMLAPRIAQESGGKVAGLVSLAGTARGYLDVVYDQNLDAAESDSQRNSIKREYRKVEELDGLGADDTVFGIPAPYLQDLYAHPVEQSLADLSIPILVLQGENDFQMHTEDFRSWQEALADYAGPWEAEMLPGLNHLFVRDTDFAQRGSIREYLQHGSVDEGVLDRIAAWIDEQLP
ncbi:MAG: alpha/beta fold hydrolase [Candidatus Spyradocola sp.]|jgi:dienelactone hydrolase